MKKINKISKLLVLGLILLTMAMFVRAEAQKCPVTVREGELVNIKWSTSDVDNDVLYRTFDGPIGLDGTWQTRFGDRGIYQITGTVSDGILTSDTSFCIDVKPGFIRRYQYTEIKSQMLFVDKEVTVKEGEIVELNAVCTRGELVIAGWMDSNVKETGYNDAGEHRVKVSCLNGAEKSSYPVTVKVIDVPRDLELLGTTHYTVLEDDIVVFDNICIDPDGSEVLNIYPFYNVYKKPGEYVDYFKCRTRSGKVGELKLDITVLDRNHAPSITWKQVK